MYYTTQFTALIGARNESSPEGVEARARAQVEEQRQADVKLIREILGQSTRILEIHDGSLRPEAKRATAEKRWRRRCKEREKYGTFRCGRFADTFISGLGQRDGDSVSP